MGKVTIAFLGATETVTGSRFLVTSSKSKILIDAGMFQGLQFYLGIRRIVSFSSHQFFLLGTRIHRCVPCGGQAFLGFL